MALPRDVVRRLAALILLVGSASASHAQSVVDLTPGARVRVTVTTPSADPHIGTFEALSDSALHVRIDGAPVAMPLARVVRLERSLGRKPNVTGGVVGLLLGGAAGGALGCLANPDDYGVYCGGQDDTKVIVGAAVGAAAGATIGALLFRRERWEEVELSGAPTR